MQLKELIEKHSNDSLADEVGSVYQVWEDGEITLQKCGRLLWQRTLHCASIGWPDKAVDITLFPHQMNNHGYAFVTREGAQEIREAILGE